MHYFSFSDYPSDYSLLCVNHEYVDQYNLHASSSHHHQVFTRLSALIRTHRAQPAFHPNAAQFTLHLGDEIFGFWRQSIDHQQSLFCLHNVTDHEVTIPLASINLMSNGQWLDLVSGECYHDFHRDLILQPYQFRWLTQQHLAG
jgi:sucrose phosphorylase